MTQVLYVGDSEDIVRRIRTNHCAGNIEGSAFRRHLAAEMGFRTSRTTRLSGTTRLRLDLPDPRVGERTITTYARSGFWRTVLCTSYSEANDFQWFAIDQLNPTLNRDRKSWKQEKEQRYVELLEQLLTAPATPYDGLKRLKSGPGVYAFYHSRKPQEARG